MSGRELGPYPDVSAEGREQVRGASPAGGPGRTGSVLFNVDAVHMTPMTPARLSAAARMLTVS